ncbi:hypothetical protein Tco_0168974 [Tanacetum coccineum]
MSKKLNRLTEDFGKRFTPQQEFSAEQAFWLRMSDPTSKPSDVLAIKIKAPKELPKISLISSVLRQQDQVENGIMELYFVRTEYHLDDIFTKPLPREIFNFLIEKLGMRSMSPDTLKCLAEEIDD